MKIYKRHILRNTAAFAASMLLIGGCSSTSTDTASSTASSASEEVATRAQDLSDREIALSKKEAQLQEFERSLRASAASSGSSASSALTAAGGSEMLPPAKPGECYARVWVDPTYTYKQQEILVSEASEQISVIPASYEMQAEQVLVKPESTQLVTIPATYETVTEQKLIKEGGTFWRTALEKGAPASQDLINAAKSYGIDLSSASPGDCFHEHYKPARFENVNEEVVISEASESVAVVPAKYRWVEKQIVVSEAGSRLESVPAVYETVTEKVLDKPAHTIWKKGKGPVQRIDASTGEIMCLVEVPATYKTIQKRVLKSAASTREVALPAKYKTIKVRELVADAQEVRNTIPAKYKTVTKSRQVSEPTFVWHEVADNTMSGKSRTGRQICKVQEQARYETVSRRIVKTPASTSTVVVPAEYDTVSIRKLVSSAQEKRTVIPAKYKTVTVKELEKDGYMEWRSILCETNMTAGRISRVQQALAEKGYDPGPADGVIGRKTIEAVNKFQRDNKLPVDKYLNIETMKALNVSAI